MALILISANCPFSLLLCADGSIVQSLKLLVELRRTSESKIIRCGECQIVELMGNLYLHFVQESKSFVKVKVKMRLIGIFVFASGRSKFNLDAREKKLRKKDSSKIALIFVKLNIVISGNDAI